MKKLLFITLSMSVLLTSCKENTKQETTSEMAKTEVIEQKETKASLDFTPITHATMVMNYGEETIYVDPTGGKAAFADFKQPTIVLITDIHGDHLSIDTLKELNLNGTIIVAPQAVVDKFPEDFKPMFKVLNNGQTAVVKDINIEAIPMYNLREEALKFHEKGRGNGYVLTFGDERVYISGDTEDIPEMRNLKNIDKAFVCMNLPYTMPIESAASAVLDFNPKTVYPYHFRGTEGLSDVEKFKSIINEGNPDINVELLEWYPNQ
ncbi:MBL fold metallo-hydrolase [Mesoflavibacter sp. SCSIO 43206]|uniref:MBL fold metallo-hydrolase n=1 Tax=Mesoflavibacter sp. SCSIO 43206 TaxID=2779362 RepID=UPI001CA9ADCD|nr:MBL fold metallo-hydrolase [Mesoflavibacter sp. SCSIO 43206]UAB75275.1 MBL fold metallo-hydrolase [Mesoflavibacter sp. SCSIO 43206]